MTDQAELIGKLVWQRLRRAEIQRRGQLLFAQRPRDSQTSAPACLAQRRHRRLRKIDLFAAVNVSRQPQFKYRLRSIELGDVGFHPVIFRQRSRHVVDLSIQP